MKLIKKYLWLIGPLVVLVILAVWFFNREKVEYAELKDEPHLKGSAEASVVLVEFSDFQCPACGAAFSLVKDLLEKYQDKIKFEYRHFPLKQHVYAFRAAEASECAADQGKFWEYHDLLFANQAALTKKDLSAYASRVSGLDVELWSDCLTAGAKVKRVEEDLTEAEKQGYNFTPTFILNNQPVEDWGSLPEQVQSLLEPLAPFRQSTSTSQ